MFIKYINNMFFISRFEPEDGALISSSSKPPFKVDVHFAPYLRNTKCKMHQCTSAIKIKYFPENEISDYFKIVFK